MKRDSCKACRSPSCWSSIERGQRLAPQLCALEVRIRMRTQRDQMADSRVGSGSRAHERRGRGERRPVELQRSECITVFSPAAARDLTRCRHAAGYCRGLLRPSRSNFVTPQAPNGRTLAGVHATGADGRVLTCQPINSSVQHCHRFRLASTSSQRLRHTGSSLGRQQPQPDSTTDAPSLRLTSHIQRADDRIFWAPGRRQESMEMHASDARRSRTTPYIVPRYRWRSQVTCGAESRAKGQIVA